MTSLVQRLEVRAWLPLVTVPVHRASPLSLSLSLSLSPSLPLAHTHTHKHTHTSSFSSSLMTATCIIRTETSPIIILPDARRMLLLPASGPEYVFVTPGAVTERITQVTIEGSMASSVTTLARLDCAAVVSLDTEEDGQLAYDMVNDPSWASAVSKERPYPVALCLGPLCGRS